MDIDGILGKLFYWRIDPGLDKSLNTPSWCGPHFGLISWMTREKVWLILSVKDWHYISDKCKHSAFKKSVPKRQWKISLTTNVYTCLLRGCASVLPGPVWRKRHITLLMTLQWRHNERDSVSNHQPHDCLLNRLYGRRLKKTSKHRVTGLCAGNSPGTSEFPAQMASNAENVSIWWRHHEAQGYWFPNILWLLSVEALSFYVNNNNNLKMGCFHSQLYYYPESVNKGSSVWQICGLS